MKKRGFHTLFIGLMVWMLAITANGTAQVSRGTQTVDAGTVINVRTNDSIKTNDSDGQVYSATVEEDVIGRNGAVAIPRGSEVELVVKETGNDLVLDLDSININGRRYGIESETGTVNAGREVTT